MLAVRSTSEVLQPRAAEGSRRQPGFEALVEFALGVPDRTQRTSPGSQVCMQPYACIVLLWRPVTAEYLEAEVVRAQLAKSGTMSFPEPITSQNSRREKCGDPFLGLLNRHSIRWLLSERFMNKERGQSREHPQKCSQAWSRQAQQL